MNILHLMPHTGGGVGSIIRAWTEADSRNRHVLTYLNDIPENDRPGQVLFEPKMIDDADIVVCHVWNHPSLFELLVTKTLPKCRIIGWSHMSGLSAPYILFEKLINYFDEFYYTSPVSNGTGIKRDHVWSTADISKFLGIEKIPHTGFNVGYVGTLDFCKIHPDFISICSQIPDANFIVVGGGCDMKTMQDQARDLGIMNRFHFTGVVTDVKPFLALFDVCLYPLHQNHIGTCEQALGEAMAAGIPCIVTKNPAMDYIIKNKINGFSCDNIEQIKDAIQKIRQKHKSIDSIIEKSVSSAKKLYSVQNKVEKWNKIFSNIMKKEKSAHAWTGNGNIFIESIGNAGIIFDDYIRARERGDFYDRYEFCMPAIRELFSSSRQWHSQDKGSILQYARYFPDDKFLQEWKELL